MRFSILDMTGQEMYSARAGCDVISITDLEIYGTHGVFPEERALGQKFFVDLVCELPLEAAASKDDLEGTVHYGILCDYVVELFQTTEMQLIESVALHIIEGIFDRYPMIVGVGVRVRKPSAPIRHSIRDVSVGLYRSRLTPIALSLGSNIGDRCANIEKALTELGSVPDLSISAISSKYDTPPWGNLDQGRFINACVTGTTTLSPTDLLRYVKSVERKLGRRPTEKWAPRIIDIDVLYYGDIKIDTPELTLPHQHLFERAFVLVPLLEIFPDAIIAGQSVACELRKMPAVDRENLLLMQSDIG